MSATGTVFRWDGPLDTADPQWFRLGEAELVLIRAFLASQHLDPHDVCRLEYALLDAPALRVVSYERDATGSVVAEPGPGGHWQAVRHASEQMLLGALPAWWHPDTDGGPAGVGGRGR